MNQYLLIGVLGLSACGQAAESFEVPVVPCDLLAGGCAEGVGKGAYAAMPATGTGPMIRTVMNGSGGLMPARAMPASLRPASMELGAKTITAAPGTTVLLEIAIGHLNRIVTPFDSPVVHTVSTAATQVDGSAVYIATENAEPISLYIADGKDAASALSLTLAPRYVPPREIVLSVPGHRKASSSGRRTTGNDARMPVLANTAAMGCEASSPPYIAGIVEVLRGMAQGRVPTGFTVQSGSGGYKPRCANGIKLKKTQVSVGPTTSVVTAAVSNTSQGPITVDHQSCTLDGQTIAATAAWPRKELAPGEETELFLVIAQGERMVDPTGHPK